MDFARSSRVVQASYLEYTSTEKEPERSEGERVVQYKVSGDDCVRRHPQLEKHRYA